MAEVTPEQVQGVLRIMKCSDTAYYEILQVSRTDPDPKLKVAYRKLSLLLHPDKNKHPEAAEAFKKVSKAWNVLSDEKLRKIYDHTGGDPEVRNGAPPPGRHPFESMFNNGANVRRGPAGGNFYQAGFDGPDGITAEELFRQFFGGGMGGGFGSPFEQTFFTSFDGPGIRVHQQHPRRHQARAQQQANQRGPPPSLLTQLSPILIFLIPVLFNFLTYLLSGITSMAGDFVSGTSGGGYGEPAFRLDRAVPPYTQQRISTRLNVPYWVDPSEVEGLTNRKMQAVDRRAEVVFMGHLEASCQTERSERDRRIKEAHGFFYTDQDMLRRAQAYPMPSCAKLKEMRSK